MKRSLMTQTKSGAASLYVVIFTTILFGVITLSFIRIMVSESSQTGDADLSQSAYDAALAGVEDAKIATNQYYNCLQKNNGAASCGELFNQDCDGLNQYLYQESGEVLIRESEESNNSTNQAYTCVILNNQTTDYRGTLSASTRVKVVPLAVNNEAKGIGKITFSWYSERNGTNFQNLDHGGKLNSADKATVPPTVELSILSLPEAMTLNNLGDSGDYASVVVLPTEDASVNKTITSSALSGTYANIQAEKSPYQLGCSPAGRDSEFACMINFDVSGFMQDNAYLIVSLPYGNTDTDFMVQLSDISGKVIPFVDVQVSVDSTGRAFDLYRRVETRLSPSDDLYPYPQFEVTLTDNSGGSDDETLNKNFWVTKNCWGGDSCRNNSR